MNGTNRVYGYNDYRERDERLRDLHFRLVRAKAQRNKHLQSEIEREIRRC